MRRRDDGRPYLIEHADHECDDELQIVFENGQLLRRHTFTEVRANLRRDSVIREGWTRT